MNAATERCGLAASSAKLPYAECLVSEPCVWVETLDADNRPTAAMQISSLPLSLKYVPAGPHGKVRSDAGDASLHIVQARQGVLVAIPAETCPVCFNSGPHTKLPHEFESWVLIEAQGARFRVSNAGFVAQSRESSTDSSEYRARWMSAIASARHIVKWASRPGLLALGVVAALAMLALADWLAATGQVTYWSTLLRQRGRLTDILVWWVGWCALARMLTGQSRWFSHLRIVALATLAYGAAKLLIPPAFAAVGVALPVALRASGWMFLAALAGWAHIAALPAKRSVRRALWLSVGAVLTAVTASPILAHFDKNMAAPALAATLPVGIDQPRETPPERALEEVAALQAAADRARSDPFK